MRRLAIALTALAGLTAAATPPLPPPPPPAPPPPPLVIVIEVDQLTGDTFDRYRPIYTGGLKRMASGTVFRNGSDGAEAPGIATTLKRFSNGSQHVAVSGSASASAAEPVDQAWRWTGRQFESERLRPPVPATIALANAGIARLIARPEPGMPEPQSCHGSGASHFARAAGDWAAFSASPALDGATLALAAALIAELRLGRDRAPDGVTVQLASTASAARRLPDGSCTQLLSLDRDLGDFFAALDGAGLYYGVALIGRVGGAGGARIPILFWRAGMVPTERLEQARTADVAPTLAAMLGLPAQPGPGKCLEGVATVACPRR